MNELERQMKALGMQKVETNEDKVYAAMVRIARETKKPVKMCALIEDTGMTKSKVASAVHRLVNGGRAYYATEAARKMGLYVPKVV